MTRRTAGRCAAAVSIWAAALLAAGCAATGGPPLAPELLHDELFAAPSQPVDAEAVFRPSEAMRRHLEAARAERPQMRDRRQWLMAELQRAGALRLEFDSEVTRNAAEAFDARRGNCLSMVIMTSAFAKMLGLSVRYQRVDVHDELDRRGDLMLAVGHVNLSLGGRPMDIGRTRQEVDPMVIDFLPPEDLRRYGVREIDESTVVAMFMNNRAVESLAEGRLDDAYAWVRAALRIAPGYGDSANTLAVIYRRRGAPALAEQVLRGLLARSPDQPMLLANLRLALADQGRHGEAEVVDRRLAALQPASPFDQLRQGLAAMAAGDNESARDLIARVVERYPSYHEFRFWLAVVHARLGDLPGARRQMDQAIAFSTTQGDRSFYASKLDRLRAQNPMLKFQ
ncbi:tetratricopeptide repeat protein [Caldimonas sp. KR1-144]|uniref:tetratricopeptide repeat protein n=1 Tax=Caldimonas sp. KR1-144 TaxID=3400911 RepID=UPI003BFD7EBE